MSEYLNELQKYANEKQLEEVQAKNQHQKFRPKPDPILLNLYPQPHQLSVEEQAFFLRITEGAFGFNEQYRNEILQILSHDYHVQFLAPHLCVFIRDAIHVNIVFPDLSLLIYAVRVTKSLMANRHVNLKQYLHLLLPAILSCVLSKRISKYNYDNHWTLRDFSAQVVASMCFHYNNTLNDITKRVIRVYMKAIQDQRKSLASLYGGIKGLGSFGEEIIKICLIPVIPTLGRKICMILEKSAYLSEPNNEAKQVKKLTDLILSIVGPFLLKHKNIDDGGVTYCKEFGYLGYSLYTQVKQLEKIENDKKHHINVFLLCAQQNRVI